MFCVECREPVAQLFLQYKSSYIKLTQCTKCHKTTDKYIEYDNVLLFIDILLLKRGALLHVANMIEQPLREEGDNKWWNRYFRHFRLYLMAFLFEVYLQWATAERDGDVLPLTQAALNQPTWFQYTYFMLNSLLQHLVQVTVVLQLLAWLGWGSQPNKYIKSKYQRTYHVRVVLTAVLISTTIKLFPILMLIWPYDTEMIPTRFNQLVGFATLIELLHTLTSFRYLTVMMVLLILACLQEVVSVWVLTWAVNQVDTVHHKYTLVGLDMIWQYFMRLSKC